MNIKTVLILSALVFGTTAYAQDSVDIHGFQLAPSDGDLHDGLSTWRGEAHEQNSAGVNGIFEYAVKPLVKYKQVGDTVTRTVMINDLTALNLGLFYAPHKRISLTAAAPLYMTVDSVDSQSGAGLGDVRLAGSVGILLPKEDRISLGLSAVPFLDIPGFYSARSQLGLEGVAGGGLVALSVTDSDRWDVSGNLGVHFTPEIEFYNLQGQERLITSVSGAYSVTEDLAVRGEWIFRPTLIKNNIPWSDSPMEAILSLRGHTGNHFGWTFGGATAISQGSGAAIWRVFAGLDLAFGARHTESIVCPSCKPIDLLVTTTDPDGNVVDVPIVIADGETVLDVDSGAIVTMDSGSYYHLNVEIQPCDTPLVVLEDDQIILLEPIYFDFDKSTIRFPDSTEILSELITLLVAHPELTLVEVAGHTDERGSNEYNEVLSQRRVDAVINYLSEHGIERERLKLIGWGERRLLHKDCGSDQDCHQLNRRVEFNILERD